MRDDEAIVSSVLLCDDSQACVPTYCCRRPGGEVSQHTCWSTIERWNPRGYHRPVGRYVTRLYDVYKDRTRPSVLIANFLNLRHHNPRWHCRWFSSGSETLGTDWKEAVEKLSFDVLFVYLMHHKWLQLQLEYIPI